jgi:20S proteasome alpha/beta subunit
MTTIIGITDGRTMVLAGDRVASDGMTNLLSLTPKVYRLGDSVVMGFAGSWRGGEIAVEAVNSLEVDGPDCNISDMTTAIAEAWREADFKNDDTSFLIGYSGQWFEIQSDLGHVEIWGDYHAIGSGSQFALGSLYTSVDSLTARQRIAVAFEASHKWTGTSESYNVVEVTE